MSRDFDGTDDNIINDNIALTALPYSFVAWMNSDSASAAQTIFGQTQAAGSSGTFIDVRGDEAGDKASSRQQTNRFAQTSTGYSINTWHHIVGTLLDNDNRAAFIDGGSKGTNTTNSTFATFDRTMIGRLMRSSPAGPFDGEIAYCAGYNVELTDAEVAILAKGVNPFFFRNDALKVYYPLDGNDSPEPEYIGQLNGTVTGTVKGSTNPPVQLLSRYMSGH